MGKYIAILALVWASAGTAAACPVPTQVSPPALPPLLVSGAIGNQVYYCMPSIQASRVGDLSPAEWAKQVQICNTNCSYEPMNPADPHSLLIPTACGPGWHDTQFQVQPPAASKPGPGTLTLKMVSSSCKAVAPSKAAPPPSPRS
jgi:hypothetical protein